MLRSGVALALLTVGGCLSSPVAWPDHTAPVVGSRKKTLKLGEQAIRRAMGDARVKLVDAPGNDVPVLVQDPCLTSGWFQLDGKPKDLLGPNYHYSWHLCVAEDDQSWTLQVSCLEVRKTETSTDSHECGGSRVSGSVASLTDGILGELKK
jgi:hypothetical protein